MKLVRHIMYITSIGTIRYRTYLPLGTIPRYPYIMHKYLHIHVDLLLNFNHIGIVYGYRIYR